MIRDILHRLIAPVVKIMTKIEHLKLFTRKKFCIWEWQGKPQCFFIFE